MRLYRHPWLVLAVVAVLTIVLGRFARHNRVDNRLEENVLQDEQLAVYYEFLDDFGNDRILIGALPFEDFDAALLRRLFDLEEKLRATGAVESIVSPLSILCQAFELQKREDFELWLESEKRVANFEKRLRDFTILRDGVISFDRKTIGVLLKIDPSVGDTDIERILELKRIMEEQEGFRGKMVVTGIPDIIRVIHENTVYSQKVFTPATLAIITVVLLLLYRSLFGVLVPLVTVLLPLIWTLGTFNLLGNSTNFITSMVPPLLLGIGLTSCIHLVTTYFQRVEQVETFDQDILVGTVRDLAPPIILCQVTTLFGFASLAVNGFGAIRQYGLYSALGLLFVLATAFILLPCLILLFRVTRQPVTSLQVAASLFEPIARFATAYRVAIVVVAVLAGALGVFGLARLDVETSLLRYLPRTDRIIRDIAEIEARTCGIVPIHLCLKRKTSLLEPSVCRAIAALETKIREVPNVDSAVSYVDLVQDYDRIFSGEPDNIPPSIEEVEEYLDFYRPEQESEYIREEVRNEDGTVGDVRILERPPEGKGGHSPVDWFITRDYRRAHIALRVRDVSSRELSDIFTTVQDLARTTLPPDVEAALTGRAFLWATASEILVRNEMANFVLALVMIDLVIIWHFGSVLVGLLALVPNVLPIVLLYGTMGYLGMTLNTVTGMLACVVIGMAVDDTIHYIHAYRTKIRSGCTAEEAVMEAMREKGSSMVFTTVVIVAGFSVLTLSQFVPTFQFGALISLTFLAALVLDLFLTPAVLLLVRPFGGLTR